MAAKASFSETVGQAARGVEAEVKRVVEFVEEQVVPRARQDTEKVLRRVADEMSRWADRLHGAPPGNQPK